MVGLQESASGQSGQEPSAGSSISGTARNTSYSEKLMAQPTSDGMESGGHCKLMQPKSAN